MSFSLALKNIKKSIKDYRIYFFTLVVAVCIFYTFNSLDTQKSMLIMNESRYEIVQTIIELLEYVSVFISVILGFLIIYSNNFLIKRRKKEFGLYLTLGMSKKKVSGILVMETLIVGLISLGIGLLFGVFLSQFLSIFTAKIFEVDMTAYKFVFSSAALFKTILYFSIIFLLVMIFNVISLSKNRLINLLNAKKKNENVKFRNKYTITIAFLLAIGLLYYAYKLLFDGAMFSFENDAIYMLVSGALGTYFLFFSISSIFLKLAELNKKFYFKNLNMFVLKQINSKANSSVLSTTIISLMLLLTIGILSGAISLVSVFNSDVSKANQTDVTITKNALVYVVDEQGHFNPKDEDSSVMQLVNQDFFSNYIKEYVVYNTYQEDNITMESLIDPNTKEQMIKDYGKEVGFNTPLDIMSESDYNKVMKLYGEKTIDLKANEYLLTVDLDKVKEFYEKEYENKKALTINNKEITPVSNEIIITGFKNSSGTSNYGTIIIDDSLVPGLESYSNTLIGNYKETNDINKFEDDFISKCQNIGSISYTTKLSMHETSIGMKAIMTFVGLYLGIIFAIASATVLAIGQLSESSDNKERYLILKKIGADDKMTNKALFSQIAVAFLLPLVVALFHSFFGLRELNGMIELLGHMDLTKSIALTSLFIVIIYGGYFVATYLASKNIVKE